MISRWSGAAAIARLTHSIPASRIWQLTTFGLTLRISRRQFAPPPRSVQSILGSAVHCAPWDHATTRPHWARIPMAGDASLSPGPASDARRPTCSRRTSVLAAESRTGGIWRGCRTRRPRQVRSDRDGVDADASLDAPGIDCDAPQGRRALGLPLAKQFSDPRPFRRRRLRVPVRRFTTTSCPVTVRSRGPPRFPPPDRSSSAAFEGSATTGRTRARARPSPPADVAQRPRPVGDGVEMRRRCAVNRSRFRHGLRLRDGALDRRGQRSARRKRTHGAEWSTASTAFRATPVASSSTQTLPFSPMRTTRGEPVSALSIASPTASSTFASRYCVPHRPPVSSSPTRVSTTSPFQASRNSARVTNASTRAATPA